MRPLSLLPLCALAPAALAQWSAPTLVPSLNSSVLEFDPAPTFNGLTIYFCSTRLGDYEIFRATRTTPYGAFGPPVQVTELASAGSDTDPCTRIDELEIFFTSTRPGIGGGDIYRATRAGPTLPFGTPAIVPELCTGSTDSSPSLTADGLRIYFWSDRPGGTGSFDIYTATRPNWTSPFGAPVPVAELNTTRVDTEPQISPDALTIFFSSDRAGGLGGRDTWVATRLDPNSPFTNLVNVTALNSTAADESPGFAWFHDEIFFVSARAGGLGSYEIYSSRFTGLLGLGVAGPMSTKTLRFSDPASPGMPYLAACALGSTPGIPIDTRIVPLNADPLLSVTIGGLPPLMTGFVGVLDADGIAAGGITFPGLPHLVGFRFVVAGLVLDPVAPSGIRTITNAHEVLVQ